MKLPQAIRMGRASKTPWLTQKQLGDAVGVTRQTIASIDCLSPILF